MTIDPKHGRDDDSVPGESEELGEGNLEDLLGGGESGVTDGNPDHR